MIKQKIKNLYNRIKKSFKKEVETETPKQETQQNIQPPSPIPQNFILNPTPKQSNSSINKNTTTAGGGRRVIHGGSPSAVVKKEDPKKLAQRQLSDIERTKKDRLKTAKTTKQRREIIETAEEEKYNVLVRLKAKQIKEGKIKKFQFVAQENGKAKRINLTKESLKTQTQNTTSQKPQTNYIITEREVEIKQPPRDVSKVTQQGRRTKKGGFSLIGEIDYQTKKFTSFAYKKFPEGKTKEFLFKELPFYISPGELALFAGTGIATGTTIQTRASVTRQILTKTEPKVNIGGVIRKTAKKTYRTDLKTTVRIADKKVNVISKQIAKELPKGKVLIGGQTATIGKKPAPAITPKIKIERLTAMTEQLGKSVKVTKPASIDKTIGTGFKSKGVTSGLKGQKFSMSKDIIGVVTRKNKLYTFIGSRTKPTKTLTQKGFVYRIPKDKFTIKGAILEVSKKTKTRTGKPITKIPTDKGLYGKTTTTIQKQIQNKMLTDITKSISLGSKTIIQKAKTKPYAKLTAKTKPKTTTTTKQTISVFSKTAPTAKTATRAITLPKLLQGQSQIQKQTQKQKTTQKTKQTQTQKIRQTTKQNQQLKQKLMLKTKLKTKYKTRTTIPIPYFRIPKYTKIPITLPYIKFKEHKKETRTKQKTLSDKLYLIPGFTGLTLKIPRKIKQKNILKEAKRPISIGIRGIPKIIK